VITSAATTSQQHSDSDSDFRQASDPCGTIATANGRATASYQGVSFIFERSLASNIKAETVTPIVLEREGDKPDSVTPKHIAFSLLGPYAEQHKSSFFQPQIHVYPIEEYKKVLAVSPEAVREFEDIVQRLATMLVEDGDAFGKEQWMPFLPYGIDATQQFHVHVKHLTFEQGKGIAFITQYNIEPTLINNNGLVYTFQGLTYDRRYYIVATFPVSAPFLANDASATFTRGYEIKWPKQPKDWDQFEKNYKEYVSKVAKRLELLSPAEFRRSSRFLRN